MFHLLIIDSFNHDIFNELFITQVKIKVQFNFFKNEDLKSKERSESIVKHPV